MTTRIVVSFATALGTLHVWTASEMSDVFGRGVLFLRNVEQLRTGVAASVSIYGIRASFMITTIVATPGATSLFHGRFGRSSVVDSVVDCVNRFE
jgi:hypothetical protein